MGVWDWYQEGVEESPTWHDIAVRQMQLAKIVENELCTVGECNITGYCLFIHELLSMDIVSWARDFLNTADFYKHEAMDAISIRRRIKQ